VVSGYENLLSAARSVRVKSYAPYSHFTVGAAILSENSAVYVGTNVENASYPESICAEASAIASMIAAGDRVIKAIAISGGPEGQESISLTPCGGCRQKIAEFAEADTVVIIDDKDQTTITIDNLLPMAFELKGKRGKNGD
jgi:cytidine deaminase